LETDLRCHNCGHQVSDLLWFGWGYSNAQQPVAGDKAEPSNTYRIGDAIRWKACSDGTSPAWTGFNNTYDGYNIGDPQVLDVIALDLFLGQQDSLGNPVNCNNCHHLIGGGAIEIRAGVIRRAWVFAPGELDISVEYYTFRADGTLQPRYDWTDTHPLYNQLNPEPLWRRVARDR